jgi:hypothetical protein
MLDRLKRQLSRRHLLRATAGLAGASAALAHLGTSRAAPGNQPCEASALVNNEPLKVNRAGVGLRGYDPDRAWRGYTLFAPQAPSRTVYLVDMLGNVVHTWEMPYPPGLYGSLPNAGHSSTTAESPTIVGWAAVPSGPAPRWRWTGMVASCGR